jgi:hypothetical protein
MREGVLDSLVGLGTGSLREHYNAVAASGTKIYLSGMSSKARGLDPQAVEGKQVEMAMPNILVRLALEADRMFAYQGRRAKRGGERPGEKSRAQDAWRLVVKARRPGSNHTAR